MQAAAASPQVPPIRAIPSNFVILSERSESKDLFFARDREPSRVPIHPVLLRDELDTTIFH